MIYIWCMKTLTLKLRVAPNRLETWMSNSLQMKTYQSICLPADKNSSTRLIWGCNLAFPSFRWPHSFLCYVDHWISGQCAPNCQCRHYMWSMVIKGIKVVLRCCFGGYLDICACPIGFLDFFGLGGRRSRRKPCGKTSGSLHLSPSRTLALVSTQRPVVHSPFSFLNFFGLWESRYPHIQPLNASSRAKNGGIVTIQTLQQDFCAC